MTPPPERHVIRIGHYFNSGWEWKSQQVVKKDIPQVASHGSYTKQIRLTGIGREASAATGYDELAVDIIGSDFLTAAQRVASNDRADG
ncbi:hypothetical protein EVAR_34108_1 [Eumeta japonica]|uniref:Uncharacterized protein n=1 Tax=Eumeta variegata TaxID=151549 RepID=A0A4C1WLE6_EUMVA|nr:hypothetical protein EVAR_34108_1 [Eumeta japonica]